MNTFLSSQFSGRVGLLLLVTLLSLAGPFVPSVKGESMADRANRVTSLVQSQKLVEARPLLVQLRSEVGSDQHANFDFYIALSYVFEYYENNDPSVLDTALTKFQAFIIAYPQDSLVPLARYNIADIYAISKKFKEALQWYIPLYQNPRPGVDAKDILKKIVLIYVAEQKWVAGIPYFEASVREAEDATERTTSAAYLLIAQAKQGEVTDSRQLLEFFKSPAPVFYTPRFNAALMEVGDQLKAEGDLASASLFYQFVRSYESLEVGLSNYIEYLERRVARFEGNVAMRNFYIDAKTELDNALADLAAMKASTNYTPLLNWRIAGVYMDMGRDWEAFWRFRLMVDKYPNHQYAEDILFSAYSLSNKLRHYEFAEELSQRYLEKEDFKQYRATVADEMSTWYLEGEEYPKLYAMTQDYLSHSAGDEASALLLFKVGMARLQRFEYPELIADFQTFESKYGHTPNGVVIFYFLGLGHLIEEDHQVALDYFERVIADPNTRFRADALFRKALAVMGLDRIEEARDLIIQFIADYPNNPLRAQAELTLGNLVDLFGDATAALAHYYLVEAYTDDLGLIASAELKISRILVEMRQADAAVERLSSFIETHRESAETIPAVAALADLHTQEGEPRVALTVIKDALNRFFELTEVDKTDTLLVDYITKDRKVREMAIATGEFFESITGKPDLFRDLIFDRAKQYRYFKEHDAIDAIVRDSFVNDEAFRQVCKEYFKDLDAIAAAAKTVSRSTASGGEISPATQALARKNMPPLSELDVWVELQGRIAELNKSIPVQTADDWLRAQKAKAVADGNVALQVRIQTAMAKSREPEGEPGANMLALFEDSEQWVQLGLAGKLWILRELAESDPDRVIEELERTRIDYMNTDVELERHKLLAKSYRKLGNLEASINAYQTLLKRFAQSDESGKATIEIGKMQIERGEYAAAREQLQTILYRNDWIGQMHGDALLWIGRAYAAEGKYSEAHGFFERIMLGYPGFPELLAQGYYEDIQVLKQMGETSSVQTVYEAFKATPGLGETEAAALIRKEFE